MAEITAASVKELRERTGAGMMDCKKALAETGGDLEQAIDWLRKKGLSAAAKKAGRVAAEGLIGAATSETKGALVEVNAETDFVARNETFQSFVRQIAELALSGQPADAILTQPYPHENRTVAEQLTQLIAVIGENMALRRTAFLQVEHGVVASYVHNATAPNLGRIGVLVALQSKGNPEKLGQLGKQIAMHIAATNPIALTVDAVDHGVIERERAVLTEQAQSSGRPAEAVAKMIEGRLRKFFAENVLLEQTFVIDNESQVKKVLEKAGAELGTPVALTAYVRLALGEGIEREEKDFAAEVQAQAKGRA